MLLNHRIISLDCTIKSHVYLVPDSKGYTLIDAGFPGQGVEIINELKSLNIDLSKIHQILITHSDWDHIGSLKYLVETLNIPAYCSKTECDNWLKKGEHYSFIPESFKIEAKKYVELVTPLTNQEYIGDFKIIYTKNIHSYGMTMYQFKDMLFVGDLIQSKSGEFQLIPEEFNLDENLYLDYIRNLDISNINYICQAHGKPLPTHPAWDNLINNLK